MEDDHYGKEFRHYGSISRLEDGELHVNVDTDAM